VNEKYSIKINVIKMTNRLIIPFILAFIFFCGHVNSQSRQTSQVKSFDATRWVKEHFAKGKIPPFSFKYGGIDSKTFITRWQYNAEKQVSDEPHMEKYVFSYKDNKSGLLVKCFVTAYIDFPAVEWLLRFSNLSPANTPVIENANVINSTFSYNQKGTFLLHHSQGSNAQRTDFQPIDEILKIEEITTMKPSGGRSSDNTAFPFFNIEVPGQQGIMVAIGWSGKWKADVRQVDEKSVTLSSGMEKMHLTLNPLEEIRTPMICLLFWKGENRMAGHNQFRQFILAHHFRKINGRFAEYPLSGSFDYGDPPPCNEYICLTEEFAIALVKRYQQFGITPELFWLDAGWYTGCGWDKTDWWQNVGNWTPEKDRFPRGLRPVADAVHAVGSKFMVWFEPERAFKGTQIDREHPEWLLKLPNNDNSLFNLGDKDARLWLTDYISDFLRKQGIDYYRQDFNFDPMPYWENNDKPDRIGISEIRHIEGLYAYWDSLLVRFPNLLIDNCASGGRRLDLETISRSAPLWRTDYQYGEPNGYQCHTYGLNFYLPIHGTAIYKTDNYTFRSGLGATAVTNWEVTGRNSEPIPAIQKRIKDYKILRPYYYGDYYPLTSTVNMTQDNVWLAYELNRPDKGDGVIIAFRRQDCPDESITVKLCGLEASANYELVDEDSGKKMVKKGEEIRNGFKLVITDKPGSLLIWYRKLLQ
jgi:alpha-galactosidase